MPVFLQPYLKDAFNYIAASNSERSIYAFRLEYQVSSFNLNREPQTYLICLFRPKFVIADIHKIGDWAGGLY